VDYEWLSTEQQQPAELFGCWYLGPVGMFVGTTQMKFDVTFTDVSGKLNTREQITATMRGESESTNVADHVAKSLAKHYVAVLKNADKNNSAKNTANPAS
jgi:RNA 3'-terminal phosphate cyclase